MTPPLSVLVETAWTVIVPLLDDVPSPDEVKPGWVAVVLMVSLIIGTILLWLSMRRQLGKVDFERNVDGEQPTDPADAPADPDDRPRA